MISIEEYIQMDVSYNC